MSVQVPLYVRRTAALIILAGILYGAGVFVVTPAVSVVAQAFQGGAELRRQMAANALIAQEKPQWEAFLADVTGGKYSAFFTQGSDANMAAAQFQSDIKGVIEAAGGEIQSIQVMPATQEAGLSRINVQASFAIPAPAGTELLQRFEKEAANIFLDDVTVTAPEMPAPGATQPANDQPAASAPKLTFQVTFYSYMLAGAAP